VACYLDIVAKNGNNVEATFDFVEATFDFIAFDNVVASTLLLVWTWLNANVCDVFIVECQNVLMSQTLSQTIWL